MDDETVTVDEVRAASPRLTSGDFATPGALVAALGALWLAMNELSSLGGQFLTPTGRHATFGELGGPTAFMYRGHWRDALTADSLADWRQLLGAYLLLDVLFIAVYATALLALVAAINDGRRHWSGRLVWALVVVDVVEDVLWFAGGVVFRDATHPVPSGLTLLMATASTVKWLAILALVVVALLAIGRHWHKVAERGREIGRALFLQRFSLLAFLPLAVLTVLPLAKVNNLFDQMPDAQRAWLDSGTGLAHLLLAAAVMGLWVLPGIFWLGRLRADWAYRRVVDPCWPNFDPPTQADRDDGRDRGGARRQHLLFWLVGPAVILVLAVLVAQVWDGTVYLLRLTIFIAVPAAIVAISFAMRRRGSGYQNLEALPRREFRFASDAMAVGDIVTFAAISLTGFGLIRAFTAETALWSFGMLDLGVRTRPVQWPVFLLLVGFALAIVPWTVSYRILRWLENKADVAARTGRTHGSLGTLAAKTGVLDRLLHVLQPGRDVFEDDDPDLQPEHTREVVSFVFLGLWIVLFLSFAAAPRWVAYQFLGVGFGVLGAATLTIGTLTLLLGSLVAYAQRRQPPELLQWIRVVPRVAWLKRVMTGSWGDEQDKRKVRGWHTTPVLTVLMVTGAAAALVGGNTDVHPVAGTGTIPDRPSMVEAFDAWIAQPDSCEVPYDDHPGMTIRPMVMYAAEGGGIRASYWTDAALQRVVSAGNQCGRYSTLLSAGASGGAFGLTLARFDSDPLASVQAVNSPEALAVASVSLAAGDLLTSATGIRFAASTPNRRSDPERLDRAGLMETALEAQWDQFRQARARASHDTSTAQDHQLPLFLPGTPDTAPTVSENGNPGEAGDIGAVTGQLVLTSSAARDGCRALISQIDLSSGQESGRWPQCGGGPAGNDSFDLFDAYSATTTGDAGEDDHCLGNVPAVTAGLLASRFPYVTPSGVVGPCNGHSSLQLLDGGYTDNTGLGTINGLQPLWSARVRDHNDQVLGAQEGQLIVPMVVYLDNGSGGDYSVSDIEIAAENAEIAQRATSRGHWPLDPFGIPEPLIPPVGNYYATAHKVYPNKGLSTARDRIQKALCTAPPHGFSDATPAQLACQDLRNGPGRTAVFVVHQQPQPSVSAPLGWELSQASMADLDSDVAYEAQHRVDQTPNDPANRAGDNGYGSLCDLLLALGVGEDGPNTSTTGAGQSGCEAKDVTRPR